MSDKSLNTRLSVIVLTKNEEERIEKCLASVSFADEIFVIDDESSDRTAELARKNNAKVFIHKKDNFSDQRNFGLSKAHGEWILYIDADEIVTDELAREIKDTVSKKSNYVAYAIPRKNIYLEQKWPYVEKLERLFYRKTLKEWYGQVHESPRISGETGVLEHAIIHRTHRSLSEMAKKTIAWSDIEAKLRLEARHPSVSWWRFPRLMVGVFFDFYIRQGGWKVGTVGLIESVYQAFSVFITYAKLWELQLSTKK